MEFFISGLAGELSLRWKGFVIRHVPPEFRFRLDHPLDILQEAYLEALECQDSFRGNSRREFTRWFETIVRRTIQRVVEEVRKREEHERSDFSLTSLSQNVEKDDDNAEAFRKLTTQLSQEEIVSMREEIDRTLEALHDLPPVAGYLIVLVCVQEIPLAEAAEKLGITPKAASQYLWRAKKELKKLLGQKSKKDPERTQKK